MVKKCLLLATALLCGLAIGAGAAEPVPATKDADLPVLVETLRANRRAMIAVNLALTEEESAKFWPLYDQYQKEVAVPGDRVAALVEDYAKSFHDLSNEKALKLMGDYLDAEAERIKIRQAYLGQFAKILPGRTVARFYQIENKMDAVLRYDLAASIPVLEPAGAAPAKK